VDIYSTRQGSPESSALNLPGTNLLGISSAGEMAVLLRSRSGAFQIIGTLARMPLSGGAPREMLDRANWADWSKDGSAMAIARNLNGVSQLEYPIGKVLYKTSGWIGDVRISPKGDRVAFLEHPVPRDDGGTASVVNLSGAHKILSQNWISTDGLAWSPDGEEIWYTATPEGLGRALRAVDLAGHERMLARAPGALTLMDTTRDGRVLLQRAVGRQEIKAFINGDTHGRELSWFDYSLPSALSDAGKLLLFAEVGEAGGATYAIYIRATDGSPAVRLGDGNAQAISPDGKWVLALTHDTPQQMFLLPTKTGESRVISNDAISHTSGLFSPDGKRIIFTGTEVGHGPRMYVLDIDHGAAKAIPPTLTASCSIPDGNCTISGTTLTVTTTARTAGAVRSAAVSFPPMASSSSASSLITPEFARLRATKITFAPLGSPLLALFVMLAIWLVMPASAASPRLRRRLRPLAMLAVLCLVAGCGGGGGSTPPPVTGTPAGTYRITITAASGTETAATIVTVVVQLKIFG
jgi:hypothetical protein